MVRASWLQGPRVQAPSRPQSKFPGVQSPSLQVSRFQVYSRPESKCTVVRRPRAQGPSIQTIRPKPSFSGMPFQISVLFIATGFVTMFCKNVETSVSCLLIQLTNQLISYRINADNLIISQIISFLTKPNINVAYKHSHKKRKDIVIVFPFLMTMI